MSDSGSDSDEEMRRRDRCITDDATHDSPLQRTDGEGRNPEVAPETRVVLLSGVDRSVLSTHLTSLFSHFGLVLLAMQRLPYPSVESAVLWFPSVADATVAKKHMDGGFINGRAVHITFFPDVPLPAQP